MFFLSDTRFLSPLAIKAACCVGLNKKGWFSSPTALQHILFFCCAGQSRPAVTKLSFLYFLPFLLLCGSSGACPIVNLNPLKFSLHYSSLHLCQTVFTPLRFSYHIFWSVLCAQLFLVWTAQEGSESQSYRCFLQFKASFTVRHHITGMLS